ncbi:NitT/TauT family transport system substrate-binding protein [Rhodoligotrophos appendicifer]|uniref:ABC transporter substrate-binding protein n=1 Tax=Rhodoligotrophos appendicifer TaxID=987056 RepID=UPI001478AB50|nr:ABC transporter substrate-binding protein [Rhodoligotrophos appendicifer]
MRPFLKTVIAAAICAMAGIGSARAADTLPLKLDWSLYGMHTPFYAGLSKGYYTDEGIDLTIAEGNSAGNVVKLVASGEDPIAFIDLGTMTIGASKGMPVKAIYGVHQKNPMVIISRKDKPVETPKALEDKVLAMAASESTAQMLPALLAVNQVDAKKINILNPAVGAKNALLLQGRTDAVTGVTYFALPIFQKQGLDVSYFTYADNGVPALEGGIVANTDWLAKNQDLAKRFLKATSRAIADAKANPEATVDEALKIRTDRSRDRDQLVAQLKLSLDLLTTENSKDLAPGAMADADWLAMIDGMQKAGLIKGDRPATDYYTNELISK